MIKEPLSRQQYKSIGPYSSKTLHKNKQDVSYVSIGDPFDKKGSDRNARWSTFFFPFFLLFPSIIVLLTCSIHPLCFSLSPLVLGSFSPTDGKQFAVASLKKGQVPTKVLFEKDIKFGPFGKLQEAINYRSVKREKGFGTSDAPKRDEFTSNMVTEQYRGLLETEKMHQRRSVISAKEVGKVQYNTRLGEHIAALEQQERELHDKLGKTPTLDRERHRNGDRSELFQYDYGRKQFTDFNPKKHRDTFYNFKEAHGKRFGKAHQTSYEHGMIANDVVGAPKKIDKKAWEFAHEATTETFFDNGHLGAGRMLG